MRLTVDVDRNMIVDIQRQLGEYHNKAPTAISRAMNRAATNINSNIKKEVRKEYNIKAGDIKDNMEKPIRSTKNRLKAEVRSIGRPIGLEKFKVSPKTVNPKRKSPIKIGVKKDGVKAVMGAFVADINGKKVFERTSKSRLPIRKLFGPSVPQMIGNEEVRTEIERKGQETFQNRLEHEIGRILERGRS